MNLIPKVEKVNRIFPLKQQLKKEQNPKHSQQKFNYDTFESQIKSKTLSRS
jgi:hypothetical protein